MTATCYICRRFTDGHTLSCCPRCPERARICGACFEAPFITLAQAVTDWMDEHACQNVPAAFRDWEEFELGSVTA